MKGRIDGYVLSGNTQPLGERDGKSVKSDRPDQDVAGVALSDPAPSAAESWPGPTQAWYAVFVLALGLMVTYLDRGILSLLVEPIKRDLHINDTQMSLLIGFAFICFYLIVALPIARLVDYKSRRTILGVGTAIWGSRPHFRDWRPASANCLRVGWAWE